MSEQQSPPSIQDKRKERARATHEDAGAESPEVKNRAAKRKQVFLTAAAGLILLLAVIGFNRLVKNRPSFVPAPQSAEDFVSVPIVSPDKVVDDQDIWRAQQAEEIGVLKKLVGDLQRGIEDRQLDDEREEVKLQTPEIIVVEQESPPPASLELPQPAAQEPPPAETRRREIGILKPAIVRVSAAVENNAGASAGEPSADETTSAAPAADDDDESEDEDSPRLVENYLPSGAVLRARTISGVDAPTQLSSQDPHPILLQVTDIARLPNFFRRHAKHCHVIAAAYGDFSSERAYIRAETFSCILPDGRVIDLPLRGFVAGEDGKNGMRGKLVSKQGQLIARSFLTGVFSGFGTAYEERFSDLQAVSSSSAAGTTTTGATRVATAGKELEYGLASGAQQAFDRLSDYYLQLADKTFPIVEIAANREVDIIIQQGVDLSAFVDPLGRSGDLAAGILDIRNSPRGGGGSPQFQVNVENVVKIDQAPDAEETDQ